MYVPLTPHSTPDRDDTALQTRSIDASRPPHAGTNAQPSEYPQYVVEVHDGYDLRIEPLPSLGELVVSVRGYDDARAFALDVPSEGYFDLLRGVTPGRDDDRSAPFSDYLAPTGAFLTPDLPRSRAEALSSQRAAFLDSVHIHASAIGDLLRDQVVPQIAREVKKPITLSPGADMPTGGDLPTSPTSILSQHSFSSELDSMVREEQGALSAKAASCMRSVEDVLATLSHLEYQLVSEVVLEANVTARYYLDSIQEFKAGMKQVEQDLRAIELLT